MITQLTLGRRDAARLAGVGSQFRKFLGVS